MSSSFRIWHIKEKRYIFRGGNSVKIVMPPFWKGVYSKMQELAPIGIPFQKGLGVQETKPEVTKFCLSCTKLRKIYLEYMSL